MSALRCGTTLLFALVTVWLVASAPACGEEIEVAGGARIRPCLMIEGKEADPGACQFRHSASGIIVEFTVARKATCRLGLTVESDQISPLAPGTPAYTATTLPKDTVWRYPYDWTHRGKGEVLQRQRLVMPGVIVGGKVILVDTHELTSISV